MPGASPQAQEEGPSLALPLIAGSLSDSLHVSYPAVCLPYTWEESQARYLSW